MIEKWKIAQPTMAISRPKLLEIAAEVPREYRPSMSFARPSQPTKSELIDFIRGAKEKFYDAPAEERKRPAKQSKTSGITAGEVNEMLRTFPPAWEAENA